MPTGIEYLDEALSPLGWGCYGPGGTAEHPNICYGGNCWAKLWAARGMQKCPECRAFRPHWHPEELEKVAHWRKPRRVGVQFMGDLFGEWVPSSHIEAVLRVTGWQRQHTFFFLTKNPQRMQDFTFPSNAWAGTTVEDTAAIMRVANLVQVRAEHKWLSIEPMLGPILSALGPYLAGHNWGGKRSIGWVVVGAQSGPGATPPAREWVEDLVAQCRGHGIKVWIKDNVRKAYPELPRTQQPPLG